MQIGRKVFYDKISGAVIVVTSEYEGESVIEKSVDEIIDSYHSLSELKRESFGVIELGFGELSGDFISSKGVHVNPETKELMFDYGVGSDVILAKPLSTEVEELKTRQVATEDMLIMIMMG